VTHVHTDCRQYRASRPCDPHKQHGARCDNCQEYDPLDQRTLIVKLGALGDVLRTTTCLPGLKQRYPRGHVTWVTRANAVELLERSGAIDRVLSIESNYLELLLAEEFDIAINPDADPLSAAILTLARSRTKIGFVSDRRGGVRPTNAAAGEWWRLGLDDEAKRANRRTYGDWLYAMCELPGPVARPLFNVQPEAVARASEFLRLRAPTARGRILFNTGASGRWEEKRWKPRHYVELARLLTQTDPGTAVVLAGGPEEAELNRELLRGHPGFIDAGTSNSVEYFAALVAACDWVLTPDSLGYHVACAVGTAALCIVGPTSPWELDVYDNNRVVYAPMPCIACYRATCPLPSSCMDALTPRVIWEALCAWRPTGSGIVSTTAVAPAPIASIRAAVGSPNAGRRVRVRVAPHPSRGSDATRAAGGAGALSNAHHITSSRGAASMPSKRR
jgi:ADP-heptose:LPS heptosyltransferase